MLVGRIDAGKSGPAGLRSLKLRAIGSIVPPLITERVKKLRQEITELTEKNRIYSLNPKYGTAVAENERRFQRLMEIAEELKGLTDWKKP
jgi:hypothetical protein